VCYVGRTCGVLQCCSNVGAAIGNLIGGAITILVSWIFYVCAARSLKRETARLQRHTALILRGLEEAGLVEWTRNEDTGEIEGIVIKARFIVGVRSDVSFTPKENDAPADQE
jgi:hypothetical protein